MACKIIYNNDNIPTGVLNQNGNPSKLFQQIYSNPHIHTFDQALDIYLETYSPKLSTEDTAELSYKAPNGTIYNTYQQALVNSNDGQIQAGINVDGKFKELFSIEVNTSNELIGGLLNNLIKSKLLTGEKYTDVDGTQVYRVAGETLTKKLFNSEASKRYFRKYAGNKSIKSLHSGDLILSQVEGQAYPFSILTVETKDGQIIREQKENLDGKTFKQLQSKYADPINILAERIARQSTRTFPDSPIVSEIEFTPENELQQALLKLLKKFGVKAIDLNEYIEKYQAKNSVAPSAEALADMANNVIAFKDGVITTDLLSEEVAHFIVTSLPQTEKANLLRNIHKTQQWTDNQAIYRDIYSQRYVGEELENAVREEILGKVLAESLQSNFAQKENANSTENNIINLLRDLFNSFIQRVQSFFTPNDQLELDKFTAKIYQNLLAEEIDISGASKSNLMLFSASTSNPTLTKINKAANKLYELVSAQQGELNKKKALLSVKPLLREAKIDLELASIESAEQEITALKAVSGIAMIAESQLNYIERALDTNDRKGYPLSQEENTVFLNFVQRTEPTLAQLSQLVDPKSELKKQLDNISAKTSKIKGKALNVENSAIDILIQKATQQYNLTETQQQELKTILELKGKDTNWFHARFGQLNSSRNGYLGLMGFVIARITHDARQDSLPDLKNMTRSLEENNVTAQQTAQLADGLHIVDYIDRGKIDELNQKYSYEAYKEVSAENTMTFEEFQENGYNPNTVAERDMYYDLIAEKTEFYKVQQFKQEWLDKRESVEIDILGTSYTFDDVDPVAMKKFKEYQAIRSAIRARETRADGKIVYGKNAEDELLELKRRYVLNASRVDSQGKFKQGLSEVFEDGKFIPVIDERIASEEAKIAHGLYVIEQLNKELYSGLKKEEGIPQSFLDELNTFDTIQEKLDFMYRNAFVSFSDEYWNSFGANESLIQRAQELEDTEELIQDIRGYQQVIQNILKANREFNRSFETNYEDMPSTAKTELKDAQEYLEDLYTELKAKFPKEEREQINEESSAENTPNEAYFAELTDSLEDEITFIKKHTTRNGEKSIKKAEGIVAKLKTGDLTDIPAYMSMFANENYDQMLVDYSRSKLLPYFKRTAPIGFQSLIESVQSGSTSVEEFMNNPLVKITPNYSFFATPSMDNINPEWLANKEAGRPQIKMEATSPSGEKISFKSQKYEDLFAPDSMGNPTKNVGLWNVRNTFLEMQRKSLEANGVDGSHDLYLLPQKHKEFSRRLKDISLKSIKEQIRDLTNYREDEELVEAFNKTTSGASIPQYGLRKLKKDQVTDELVLSYAWMRQQSALYKARTENIGDMFAIKDAILNADYGGKEAETTNTYKMFKSFMDSGFYGIQETMSYKFKLPFTDFEMDLAKLVRSFNNFVIVSNLSGITVPLVSLFTGSVQKFIETRVGETINPIASKLANKYFYGKNALEASGEILKVNSKAEMNVILENFGAYDVLDRYQDTSYGRLGRGGFEIFQATHKMANFPIIPKVGMAVLFDNRYVTNASGETRILDLNQFRRAEKIINPTKTAKQIEMDWEKLPLFFEDIQVENGSMTYKKDAISAKTGLKEQELDDYLNLISNSLTGRMSYAIQQIDQQISPEQKSMASRNAVFNLGLTHKSWLTLAAQKKFKSRSFNFQTGEAETGYYLTAFEYMRKIFGRKALGRNFFKNLKSEWEQADETTRRNLYRALVDTAVVNSMLVMALILASYNDGDDEAPYALLAAEYFLYRTSNEALSVTTALPLQFKGVIESPLVMSKRFFALGDIGDAFSGDLIQRGNFANHSKQYKFAVDNIAFLKDAHRLVNIEQSLDTYRFFNKGNEDWSLVGQLIASEEED